MTVAPSTETTTARHFGRRLGAVCLLIALGGVGLFFVWPNLKASSALRAAKLELEERDFRSAKEHLEACLQTWPHDEQVLLLSAQLARRSEKYLEAEDLLARCQHFHGN